VDGDGAAGEAGDAAVYGGAVAAGVDAAGCGSAIADGVWLRRGGVESFAETSAEREAAHVLTVTQLDQAATAAHDACAGDPGVGR